MKINAKPLPRFKRWSAGSRSMRAAATALRGRQKEVGRVLIQPPDPDKKPVARQVFMLGEQKKVRRLHNGIAAKQGTIVAAASRQTDDDRARRLEVLMGTFGMWKGRQDLPQEDSSTSLRCVLNGIDTARHEHLADHFSGIEQAIVEISYRRQVGISSITCLEVAVGLHGTHVAAFDLLIRYLPIAIFRLNEISWHGRRIHDLHARDAVIRNVRTRRSPARTRSARQARAARSSGTAHCRPD